MNLPWNGLNILLGFSHIGITLKEEVDFLAWDWNNKTILISTKDAYDTIFSSSKVVVNHWWYNKSWNWYMPVKIKCFSWSSLEKKILNYYILMKKWFISPNFCILCKSVEKNISHSFVDWLFYHEVWAQILKNLPICFS